LQGKRIIAIGQQEERFALADRDNINHLMMVLFVMRYARLQRYYGFIASGSFVCARQKNCFDRSPTTRAAF
jgi:hypothetical protein